MSSMRLDNLPMDRQAASSARTDTEKGGGLSGPATLKAVFEKRDVDPTAHTFKRRHGSKRTTNEIPNYLGIAANINKGAVEVDHDFFTETGTSWQAFATVHCPRTHEDAYAPIFSYNGVYIYVVHTGSTGALVLAAYNVSGSLLTTAYVMGDADTQNDFRIAVRRYVDGSDAKLAINAWVPEATPGNDNLSSAFTFLTAYANRLVVLGPLLTAVTVTPYDEVVITNFSLWSGTGNAAAKANYETYAVNLAPGNAGTVINSSTLRYHEAFTTGGDILAHHRGSENYTYSYLTPTIPTDHTTDAIHFGGKGIIEIPFYLDFDEYYWTATRAQEARTTWQFVIEVTLPAHLEASTVYDFQDIARLEIVESSGKKFKATFNGTTELLSSKVLAAGTTYQVWVSRLLGEIEIDVLIDGGVNDNDTNATPPNPVIFNYDKSLGFVIGDTADAQNSAPFGGKIKRIALYNEGNAASKNIWGPKRDAVFYYDPESITGDFVLDRGNRGLNGNAGTRIASAAPFYKAGGFSGGSYVAAIGGYTMSSAMPSAGFSGELKKSITKDAVVQRRGSKSFLTTNGHSYVIDDLDKTFRPLGLPRPATKVGCTPQGIGSLDGFVRYGYRWVSKDGTVGPALSLDPIDARGGVNVFLGADSYGIPGNSPFGISFGECEGKVGDAAKGLAGSSASSSDCTVESFLVRDSSDNDFNEDAKGFLLGTERAVPGLTLETAFRLPNHTSVRESIFGQGVMAPSAATWWWANHKPYNFQEVAAKNEEWTIQFAFRYSKNVDSTYPVNQMLIAIGPQEQYWKHGSKMFPKHDYRVEQLVVSIQNGSTSSGLNPVSSNHPETALVICRDDPSASKCVNNALQHISFDYHFEDGSDYVVYVKRGRIGNSTNGFGEDLIVSIYNKTIDNPGTLDGWARWVDPASYGTIMSKTERHGKDFFGKKYNSAAPWPEVRWGGNEGHKTRARASVGSGFTFTTVRGMYGGTGANNIGGSIMYHARIWTKAIPLTVLRFVSLDRYGARSGILNDDLEVDLAFCPDSSQTTQKAGWDVEQDMPVNFEYINDATYFGPGAGTTFLSSAEGETNILAYGWDMSTAAAGAGNNDDFQITSTDNVAMWAKYTPRNEGSLVIGVGRKPQVTIGHKKWYAGAKAMLFDDFAGTIDLKEWTWITLYYHHVYRQNHAAQIEIYLERVFIDGNTGDAMVCWEAADAQNDAKYKNNKNSNLVNQRYGLFMVGGLPGHDQNFDVELAEVRLWDGERYTAAGGGKGTDTFGPYMSARIPPNLWDKLWYYLRFAAADVNDDGDKMDQKGLFVSTHASHRTGQAQTNTEAVLIQRNATVKDGRADEPGNSYYVPFPEAPSKAIRGIQIFRSQVIPVTEKFPNGNVNPDAITDAWRACRDAPLYFLTEIPRGTTSYLDFADDTALGEELDPLSGLLPRNPRGVFEWEGYLGVYVDDRPRIHFAESPNSWESFPTNRILELPLREYGPVEAAVEIASRDARHSRVLCLGKSWGAFLDGSPQQPLVNTLGGGVGASSPRCLVVEKGIAYAYNGTLWAITGDGQVEDIGAPVLDLLPATANARLSVSSTLSSLFVIDESTGLALRFHFMRRQWFVEDRYALSVTDVDGVDNWIHVSGYPSQGSTSVYQDDVQYVAGAGDNTPAGAIAVSSFNNGADTFVVSSATGLKVGQRVTLVADRATAVADRNPLINRQTITIKSINSTTITCNEDLDLASVFTDLNGTSHSVLYNAYVGVGEEGTMIDTGQFNVGGEVSHVDVGIDAGDGWWATFDASDFAKDPTSRAGILSAESQPTSLVDASGDGASARWGLSNRQRLQRILVWSQIPTNTAGDPPTISPVGLTELELDHSRKTEG